MSRRVGGLRRLSATVTRGTVHAAAAMAVLAASMTGARPSDRRGDVAATGIPPAATTDAAVTQGAVTFANGSTLGFIAVAGRIAVGGSDRDDAAFDSISNTSTLATGSASASASGRGPAVARMSYVAYLAHGSDARRRPLLFLYDGGPGSSSRALLMTSFGPVRVAVPQPGDAAGTSAIPKIVNNPDSLLDVADLVFVDAPGTGFGGIEGQDAPAAFYGIDGDAAAFARFIERFRGRFLRWTSPLDLFGHSYGTMRSAVLARLLSDDDAPPSGIVSADPWLNADDFLDSGPANPGTDNPYVDALPTYAAIAWYHHRVANPPATLRPWLDEVEAFALHDFATALLAGDTLSTEQEQAISKRLERYTGVSAETWVKARLRVSGADFRLADADRAVGRTDARYVATVTDPLASNASGDAFGDAIGPTIAAATRLYECCLLKLGSNFTFNAFADVPDLRWNEFHSTTGKPWESFYNVMPDLAKAMTQNPTMRVLLIGGTYDLATTYLASLQEMRHLAIPPAVQANIETAIYPTGHEPYVVDAVRREMHDRIAHLIHPDQARHPTGRPG